MLLTTDCRSTAASGLTQVEKGVDAWGCLLLSPVAVVVVDGLLAPDDGVDAEAEGLISIEESTLSFVSSNCRSFAASLAGAGVEAQADAESSWLAADE